MSAAKIKAQNIIDENKVGGFTPFFRFVVGVSVFLLTRSVKNSCVLEVLLSILQVDKVAFDQSRCAILRSRVGSSWYVILAIFVYIGEELVKTNCCCCFE